MPLLTQSAQSIAKTPTRAARVAPRATLGAIVISAGLALAVGAPVAGAAPVWHAAVNLAPVEEGSGETVALAMNPGGDAIAAWDSVDGGVGLAARPAGGPLWKRVEIPAVGRYANQEPAVAVSPAGEVIAVWIQPTGRPTDPTAAVLAATRQPGGEFSSPVRLSPPVPYAEHPQVAVDAAGNALIVWAGDHTAQAVTRAPGASFSAPITLTADGDDPQLAMGRTGQAIVVWLGGKGVQAATRAPGAGFSAPVDVSRAGEDASYPEAAINGAGDALAVWHAGDDFDGISHVVRAAARPAGGTFSAPVRLSTGANQPGEHPQAAIDEAGGAVVVWHRFKPLTDENYVNVQAATRPAGGAFSRPVNLAGRGSGDPHVAMNRGGDAVAVWSRGAGRHSIVQAAVRRRGAAFSAPKTLSVADRLAESPQVAIDEAGHAVTAWHLCKKEEAPEDCRPQAAVYDEATGTPAVSGLRVSPRGFRAARSGPAVTSAWAQAGALVTYSVDKAAKVRFSVQRVRGRRFVRLPGGFNRRAGAHRFRFTGRLAGRRLAPGRYRLIAVPTVEGHTGKAAHARFRIMR